MLRMRVLYLALLFLSWIAVLPCKADPWGEVSLRLGWVDSQRPAGGMALGGDADLLVSLGRKFQTGIEFGLYDSDAHGRVSQGSWQWRFRTPTGVARPYATLGTGIYSASTVIPVPDGRAPRIVTSPNLGLNYGFGVGFLVGARALLGFDFRIHSFGSESYNPRKMLNVTLGLAMNLGD